MYVGVLTGLSSFLLSSVFKADQLAPQNLATLLKCSLESQTTYPVEAWKLFFQKVSSSLNDTLVTFATMVNPSAVVQICSHSFQSDVGI